MSVLLKEGLLRLSASVCLSAGLLVGCGGGGGDGGTSPPAVTHQVSATAGTGGSITPSLRTVNDGATTTFTVAVETGYTSVSVSGCGGNLSGNTYTTGQISSTCSVSAQFALRNYSITANAGVGGGISPASQSIAHGQSGQFEVTAAVGYEVVSVSGCGGSLSGSTYTTSQISDACSVSVQFALRNYNVIASAGDGGSINPSLQSVTHGQMAQFEITASEGYEIASVTGCGGSLSGNTYTTGQITEACSVAVVFENDVPPEVAEATGKLNDTGITSCSNNSYGLNCPVAGFEGQDGDYGRDVSHNDDSDGHAGFSFTKLDGSGRPLPASASDWSCVKDNVTGLIWEIKTNDGGLRDMNHSYSWYNSNPATNGGDVGTESGGTCYSAGRCDTEKFVADVNAAGLCGAKDWRMPTIDELQSIVDYSRFNPAIDSDWFPYTGGYIWSSSLRVDYLLADDKSIPLCLNLYGGYIDCGFGRDSTMWVHLVRDGR